MSNGIQHATYTYLYCMRSEILPKNSRILSVFLSESHWNTLTYFAFYRKQKISYLVIYTIYPSQFQSYNLSNKDIKS